MKVTIMANAYAIQSTIKVSDIALLAKSNSNALTITDDDGNQKFAIGYAEGESSITDFGVTFGGKTRDENSYATITGSLPSTVKTNDAAKEYVADLLSSVNEYLVTLEESVPKAADKIREQKKKLLESITIA